MVPINCSDEVIAMILAATSFFVSATAWLRQEIGRKDMRDGSRTVGGGTSSG